MNEIKLLKALDDLSLAHQALGAKLMQYQNDVAPLPAGIQSQFRRVELCLMTLLDSAGYPFDHCVAPVDYA
jgi:hypothetical protein